MSNAARQLEHFSTPCGPILAPANTDTLRRAPLLSISTIATVLICLQILDGALTFTGMSVFGVGAEGNPLLRSLMDQLGLVPALVTTKIGCIGVVLALCSQSTRVTWLPAALSLVAVVYAACAVVPWSLILASAYFG